MLSETSTGAARVEDTPQGARYACSWNDFNRGENKLPQVLLQEGHESFHFWLSGQTCKELFREFTVE